MNFGIGTGGTITIPRIVAVVVGTFLLYLLQGLPLSHIPNPTELYKAILPAVYATVALLLNGGSGGGNGSGNGSIPMTGKRCK